MSDENMAKAPDGFQKASFGFTRKIFSDLKDKVTRYEWGKEVAPGITSVETAGHTPGHTSFVIASGSSKMLFQADVTNVPDLFLTQSGLAGHVRQRAREGRGDAPARLRHGGRRKDVGCRLSLPVPGLGYIEKAGTGYRLVPVAWNPML